MIPLTEETNQENGQDQQVNRDRETIKVQEKLEWASIEMRMGMKLEVNRKLKDEEPLEEEIRTNKEEDKATKIEINHIKKDIERRKSTTNILSKTSTGQRVG